MLPAGPNKDITLPSLPWEVERPVMVVNAFNSPGDYIQQTAHFQLQVNATRIIFSHITNENGYLPDIITMNQGDNFAQLVRLVATLSQNFLESTLSSLLVWRRSMNPFADISQAEQAKLHKLSKDKIKKTAEDHEQDERRALIVDYIFAELLERSLEYYDGVKVIMSEKSGMELESLLFRFITDTSTSKHPVGVRNREYVRDQFKRILGQLGAFRIGSIMDGFLELYQKHQKNTSFLHLLLDGMEHVFVNSSMVEQVNQACGMFPIFFKNFRSFFIKNKKTDIRNALCALIGSIYGPLASSELVLGAETRKQGEALFEMVEVNVKKSKNPQLFPIAVISLCVTSTGFFYGKIDALLEMILLAPKEPALRTMQLESLFTLIFASVTKYDDKNEGRRQRVRGLLAANLYPIGKKPLYPTELEHIDIIVDIIELLSIHDVESVVSSIIIPFLQSTQPPVMEQLLIGFVSFMKVYHQPFQSSLKDRFISPMMKDFYSTPRCTFRKKGLNELAFHAKAAVPSKIGEAHMKQASDCVSSTLQALHPTVAQFSKQYGFIEIESIPRDKMFQIYTTEAVIQVLQTCMPPKMGHNELLGYLSHYTLHSYHGLAKTATKILRYLMAKKISYRGAICETFTKFANSVDDSEPQLMAKNAENFLELLRIWYDEIKAESEKEEVEEYYFEFEKVGIPVESDLDFSLSESLALLYLCTPHSHTRCLGFEIIKTCTALHEFFYDMGDSTQSIYPFIVESAPFLVQESFHDPHSVLSSSEECIPHIMPSLDALLQKTKKESIIYFSSVQRQWSRILAGILQVTAEQSPQIAKQVWISVKDRILPVQHEMEMLLQEKPTDPLFDEVLLLWSNYFHMAMGCASVQDSSIFENQGTERVIESSRDLFKNIIPFMFSDNEKVRTVARDCFSFVPSMTVDSAITELGNYHRLAFMDDKCKHKIKKQYGIMLAYAYHSLSKNWFEGFLFHRKGTIQHHLDYIRYQLLLIPDTSPSPESVLEHLYWRFHLCLYVDRVLSNIMVRHGTKLHKLVDDSLFDAIFDFLLMCNGFPGNNNALNEVQISKERKQYYRLAKTLPDPEEAMKSFETKAKAVREVAGASIARLCFTSCGENEEQKKFNWIRNVFSSTAIFMKKYAKQGFVNILRSNLTAKKRLFSVAIELCYCSDHNISAWAFYTLVDIFIHGHIPLSPPVALCLALHKMADSIEQVRENSVRFLIALTAPDYFPGQYSLVQNTGVFDCYYHSQTRVASQMATLHPGVSLSFIEEAFLRFRSVDGLARERLQNIMVPFFLNIELHSMDSGSVCGFLERLLVITLKYGEEFTSSVAQTWINLAHNRSNVCNIINYLISLLNQRRTKSLILTSSKVVLLLSRALPQDTITKLVYELYDTPKVGPQLSEVEKQISEDKMMEETAQMPSSWPKDFLFMFPAMDHLPPFSRSNLAMILLADIIVENFPAVQEFLHVIIVVGLLAQDSSNLVVVKYGKTCLANILFSSVGGSRYRSLPQWANILSQSENQADVQRLWSKDDFICRDGTLDTSQHVLVRFVSEYMNLLEEKEKGICARVATLALEWARTSTRTEYICRSLQVYRYLAQPLHPEPLSHILFCLHRHLIERDPSGSRAVMFEALSTLHAMATSADTNSVLEVPQLWWATLSCLQSDCEEEYWLSLDLLAVLLQQFDFEDHLVTSSLMKYLPTHWTVPFHGIQPLILKGMTSGRVEESARALLSEFLAIDCPELIDNRETRYIDNILVLLPYLMIHIDSVDTASQEQTIRITQNIRTLCDQFDMKILSDIFQDYARGEFNDATLFIRKLMPSFVASFIQGYELRTLSLLRNYICYAPVLYQKYWMIICSEMLRHVTLDSEQLRHKSFAIFHSMIPLIISNDWMELFDVFNAAVAGSGKGMENYQFTCFPNPSTVARILDRFESPASPWASVDQNKSSIGSALLEMTDVLEEKFAYTSQRSSDPTFMDSSPMVQEATLYYSHIPLSNENVLQDGELTFQKDELDESAKRKPSIPALYESPLPILIAKPSSDAPASPMALRKNLLSPRKKVRKSKMH